MKSTLGVRSWNLLLPRVGRPHVAASRRRRGLSTMWVIVAVPVLLVAFCFVINVANLWLARVELENALEASALAAVKEWAESGDTSTLIPRQIGVDFAAANTIRCEPTEIGTNWDPNATEDNPNENLDCEITPADPANNIPPGGNLIFGSIIKDEDAEEVVFDAGRRPQCAGEMVLLDASGQGGGGLAGDNNSEPPWGISFLQNEDTPLDLRIDRIVIDLRASGGNGSFEGTFVLTQPSNQDAVHDNSGNTQPNIEGFPNPSAQIEFIWGPNDTPAQHAGIVTIRFHPDPLGPDTGFNPGDRFRFRAGVEDVSSGSGSDDGDGIGRDGTGVTVFFDGPGLIDVPFSGLFVDNTDRSNDCIDPALVDPITGSLIVHPQMIPDLPCPPSAAANNNGQSFALVGGDGRDFGVRAQATVPVPLLVCPNVFSNMLSYCVTVKVTAVYDCRSGQSRLIRIDRFICP